MAIKIKYVGPLDEKRANGITFKRLQPYEVPDNIAHSLLNHPDVFLPADADVPDEVLALREKRGHALIKEGKDRLKGAQKLLVQAEMLPDSDERQRAYKTKSIQGAESEIAYAEGVIAKGQAWLAKVRAEHGPEVKPPATLDNYEGGTEPAEEKPKRSRKAIEV